jgi:hypothetical protein
VAQRIRVSSAGVVQFITIKLDRPLTLQTQIVNPY